MKEKLSYLSVLFGDKYCTFIPPGRKKLYEVEMIYFGPWLYL